MFVESIVTKTQTSALLLLMLTAFSAHADDVMMDGQTYRAPHTLSTEWLPVTLNPSDIQRLAEKTATLQPSKIGFQPLKTHAMRVCQNFKSRSANRKHLFAPVFIVGDDPVSLHWMRHYQSTLNKIHAVGLVVSADSIHSIKKIKTMGGGVRIYPAEGNAVSQFFGITCYPVLISKHWIEQ